MYESCIDVVFGDGRGYQRVGESITKGIPDFHEAIEVSSHGCIYYVLFNHMTIQGVKMLGTDRQTLTKYFSSCLTP